MSNPPSGFYKYAMYAPLANGTFTALSMDDTGELVTANGSGNVNTSQPPLSMYKAAVYGVMADGTWVALSLDDTGALIVSGSGGSSFTPAGDYSDTVSYSIGDVVSDNGSSYISLTNDNIGNDPSSSPDDWQLLAAAGAPGPTGPSAAGLTITTVSAATTMTADANPQMLRVNGASLSTVVVTLPEAPDTGEIIYVKNVGAGNVVLDGNGVPIDGDDSVTMIAASTQGCISIAFDAVSNTWNMI